MKKFQGTLNKPNYLRNKGDRRYFMYVKIQELFRFNTLKVRIYKGRYWHYTFKVNIWSDRKRNSGMAVRNRTVVLLPWK